MVCLKEVRVPCVCKISNRYKRKLYALNIFSNLCAVRVKKFLLLKSELRYRPPALPSGNVKSSESSSPNTRYFSDETVSLNRIGCRKIFTGYTTNENDFQDGIGELGGFPGTR